VTVIVVIDIDLTALYWSAIVMILMFHWTDTRAIVPDPLDDGVILSGNGEREREPTVVVVIVDSLNGENRLTSTWVWFPMCKSWSWCGIRWNQSWANASCDEAPLLWENERIKFNSNACLMLSWDLKYCKPRWWRVFFNPNAMMHQRPVNTHRIVTT